MFPTSHFPPSLRILAFYQSHAWTESNSISAITYLTVKEINYAHQVPPCLLFVIFGLELINLKKPFKPRQNNKETTISLLSNAITQEKGKILPYVRFPSCVTSKDSISSSFVSFVKGVSFVSYAHLSRPSVVKYASVGEVRNTKDSSDFSLGF
jgi:hypothetical protein